MLAMVFLLTCHSVFASPCECPPESISKTSGASGACGKKPVPAALVKPNTIHQDGRTQCPAVPKVETAIPNSAKIEQNMTKGKEASVYFANPATKFIPKSEAEVLDFFNCYHRWDSERGPFCHYKNTLAPFIKLSSESIEMSTGQKMPYSVAACLYYVESKFKSSASSSKDAKGYVQVEAQTLSDLNLAIRHKPEYYQKKIDEKKQKLYSLDRMIASLRGELIELRGSANSQRVESIKSKVEKLTEDRDYLESDVFKDYRLQKASQAWTSYWRGTEKIPSQVEIQDTSCPQMAFGISAAVKAMHLAVLEGPNFSSIEETPQTRLELLNQIKSLENRVKTGGMSISETWFLLRKVEAAIGKLVGMMGESQRIKEMVESMQAELTIMLAGAYNSGPSRLASVCRASGSLEDCMNEFKSKNRNETYNHMRRVRNCSQKHSYEPASSGDSRECEKFKCGEEL